MAWLDFLGRARGPKVGGDRLLLVRNPVTIASLKKPPGRVIGPVATPTCVVCGKPLEERVIATGALGMDVGLWNEVPFAVDGWACERDGSVAYPRPIDPATITSFGRQAAHAMEEKRPRDADWWMTRMLTNWPGFGAGYVDLSQALAARLRHEKNLSTEVRRLVQRRLRAALEDAVTFCTRNTTARDRDLGAVRE
jgi:hypothetical protein